MLARWYDYGTNCEIASSPQFGKTKCVEWMARDHIRARRPLLVIDYHGTLYRSLVAYAASIGRKNVQTLDLGSERFLNGFNPFALKGGSVYAHVSRVAESIMSAWGVSSMNETPRLERILVMVLTYAAITGKPLHDAANLLSYPAREARADAIHEIPDREIRQYWIELDFMSRNTRNPSAYRNFLEQVESTRNRLRRFIGSDIVKAVTSREGIDLEEIWATNGALLVNIAPTTEVSAESSRVIAALLLSELERVARKRMFDPKPFFAYFDECQKYLHPAAASMIDELLKSGLRMTFVHHHEAEFGDKHLVESLRFGAGIKIVFGGMPRREAMFAAGELLAGELNKRVHKEPKIQYVTTHHLETYEDVSEGESSGESLNEAASDQSGSSHMVYSGGETSSAHTVSEGGGSSFTWANAWGSSRSVKHGTRYRPELEERITGYEDYSLEEKTSMLAEKIMKLERRECLVKLPARDAMMAVVPALTRPLLTRARLVKWLERSQTKSLPRADALALVSANSSQRSRQLATGEKPKKRPARLHQQE